MRALTKSFRGNEELAFNVFCGYLGVGAMCGVIQVASTVKGIRVEEKLTGTLSRFEAGSSIFAAGFTGIFLWPLYAVGAAAQLGVSASGAVQQPRSVSPSVFGVKQAAAHQPSTNELSNSVRPK